MNKLSILIPTLPIRKPFLDKLINIISYSNESVEVLIDDRVNVSTGEKRNSLLERSTCEYVWQVDDDDEISVNAIELIINATKENPDVIGINGYMTTDGKNKTDFEIRLGSEYKAIGRNGNLIYIRSPNHITPMKREHAIKIKFPDKTIGEDYEWCMLLKESGLLKTQEIITEKIYHYKYRSIK